MIDNELKVEMSNERAHDILQDFQKFMSEHSNLFSDEVIDATNLAVLALEKQIPVKPVRRYKRQSNGGATFWSLVPEDTTGLSDTEELIVLGNWMDTCPNCDRLLCERVTDEHSSTPYQYNMTNRCLCGQALIRE